VISRRRLTGFGLGLIAIVGVTGVRIAQWRADPDVCFLAGEQGARWIRKDLPFHLTLGRSPDTATLFGCHFAVPEAVVDARLTLRAFRRCEVVLDGNTLYRGASDLSLWKQSHEVPLPALAPGTHELQIAVFNRGGPPCLLAYCQQLALKSGPGWDTAVDRQHWVPAVPVDEPVAPTLAGQYPSTLASLAALAPMLAAIFVGAFSWTLWQSRVAETGTDASRWQLTPSRLRWLLLAAWAIMGANNSWQIPADVGYDAEPHLDYVRFIVENGRLPLATDGWQMFQSPLFYLLAAPVYALSSSTLGAEGLVKLLRVLPLACGLAQIEIVYRAARAVFPGQSDLQKIATVVGGLMPMHIYISQFIGNEPLAGCLSSLLVLMCLLLLVEPARPRSRWFFCVLGAIWGLALLAKVTPLLLAPLLAGAIVVHGRGNGASIGQPIVRAGLVGGACLLVAGWYFLRNQIALGKPFASGWDPSRGISWWQDPGYRTWAQLSSFGLSLWQPVYSGSWSLWDSLYSTLFLDGFTSGLIATPDQLPWNICWMTVGAPLALVPLGLMLLGACEIGKKRAAAPRSVLLFSTVAIAIYLAAVIDLYVRLPIYSTAKGTYLLGLLPCFALLAAAGAAPLVRKRKLRAAVKAAITCWAAAAWLAYFNIPGPTPMWLPSN
jgi:hypothetical protein